MGLGDCYLLPHTCVEHHSVGVCVREQLLTPWQKEAEHDRTGIWIIYSQQPTLLTYFPSIRHQFPPPPKIESAVNNQGLTSYPSHTVVQVASKRLVTFSKCKNAFCSCPRISKS